MVKEITKEITKEILDNVTSKSPLVHCMTNYVTVNDVANILLACGGSPIMADDRDEVEDITSLCDATVINIGTLNARTVEAMLIAGKKANQLSHVVVLDPVGAGASALRTNTTFELLKKVDFSVIRGNISEIKTVALGGGNTKGVDADTSDAVNGDNLKETIAYAKSLSATTGAVIVITGSFDIVADSTGAYIIRNGNPLMSKITGTGCMLTGIIAAYCAANPNKLLEAAAVAVSIMGLCGELAYRKLIQADGGNSTYRTYIIDFMSKMKVETLWEGMKIESQ